MPGRANDLIVIPDTFWQRTEVTNTLRSRDMGRFFELVQQYTGASQTQIGMACGLSQGKVSNLEHGAFKVKHLIKYEEIADGLNFPDSARIILGLAPRAPSPHRPGSQPREAIPTGDTRPTLQPRQLSGLLNLGLEDEQQEKNDPVRRRTFVGLTGAAMLDAVLADTASNVPMLKAEPFAQVLTVPSASSADATPRMGVLEAAVDNAFRQFAACRYSDLINTLPALLGRLEAACVALEGEERSRAFTLCADAHRIASDLLLFKLDDQGLGYLAADRGMRAALESGDPVTVATAARAVAAAMMNGGHFDTATSTASIHAQRLHNDIPAHTPESLSVYGRSCYLARRLRPARASATPPTNCSAKPMRQRGGLASMATIAGQLLARPMPSCTA